LLGQQDSRACSFLCYFLYKKQYKELQKKKVWLYSLFVALLTGVCFYGLFFWGLNHDDCRQTLDLSPSLKTFTSFVFFSILRREHFKTEYKVGAVLMVLGAGCVLFRNFSGINQGDLLIVAATFFAPGGQHVSAKTEKDYKD
jgi:drug/metabolite transporter (DMT)-like permease